MNPSERSIVTGTLKSLEVSLDRPLFSGQGKQSDPHTSEFTWAPGVWLIDGFTVEVGQSKDYVNYFDVRFVTTK